MQRRQILAALGAVLGAGCLGAKRPPTSSAGVRIEGGGPETTPMPTAEPTATPTPEPTETPEPEATETETPEPETSADVSDGDDALAAVQSSLTDAVTTYAGADNPLSGVRFTGNGFDVRAVLVSLDTVQRELVAAEDAVVTDDQQSTLDALVTAERFLTHSALAHSYLAESFTQLDAAYLDFVNSPSSAESAENRFDTTLDEASSHVSALKNDVDGDAVATADAFDADSYDDVLSVFDSLRDAFDEASSGLDRFVQGIDELADAREAEDNGDEDDAAALADDARTLFDEGYDFFTDAPDALTDDVPDAEHDALDQLFEDFRSLADEFYLDAQDVYDDNR